MELHILPHNDYDQKLKLKKQHVHCYSKGLLKKRYSDKDFQVVGEAKSQNRKEAVAELVIGGETLTVSEAGGHSRLLNRTAGYFHVGGDDYVAILKSRIPFLLLLFALLAGLAAGIAVLVHLLAGPTAPVIDPYHPLPAPDPNVEPIEKDNSSKADPGNGGGSVSMIYTLTAGLSLSDNSISMYFKNPNASNHDVVLELYLVDGETEIKLAQSGLIKAGYGLYEMTMIKDAAVLQEGNYQGKYKVLYYNPDTGERALVESDIDGLTIAVTS